MMHSYIAIGIYQKLYGIINVMRLLLRKGNYVLKNYLLLVRCFKGQK